MTQQCNILNNHQLDCFFGQSTLNQGTGTLPSTNTTFRNSRTAKILVKMSNQALPHVASYVHPLKVYKSEQRHA